MTTKKHLKKQTKLQEAHENQGFGRLDMPHRASISTVASAFWVPNTVVVAVTMVVPVVVVVLAVVVVVGATNGSGTSGSGASSGGSGSS